MNIRAYSLPCSKNTSIKYGREIKKHTGNEHFTLIYY